MSPCDHHTVLVLALRTVISVEQPDGLVALLVALRTMGPEARLCQHSHDVYDAKVSILARAVADVWFLITAPSLGPQGCEATVVRLVWYQLLSWRAMP